MQLIHLTLDPRNIAGEIDLVAENLTGLGGDTEGVQCACDNAGGLFLVIEDGQHGGTDSSSKGR